jgi:hypothetical protein
MPLNAISVPNSFVPIFLFPPSFRTITATSLYACDSARVQSILTADFGRLARLEYLQIASQIAATTVFDSGRDWFRPPVTLFETDHLVNRFVAYEQVCRALPSYGTKPEAPPHIPRGWQLEVLPTEFWLVWGVPPPPYSLDDTTTSSRTGASMVTYDAEKDQFADFLELISTVDSKNLPRLTLEKATAAARLLNKDAASEYSKKLADSQLASSSLIPSVTAYGLPIMSASLGLRDPKLRDVLPVRLLWRSLMLGCLDRSIMEADRSILVAACKWVHEQGLFDNLTGACRDPLLQPIRNELALMSHLYTLSKPRGSGSAREKIESIKSIQQVAVASSKGLMLPSSSTSATTSLSPASSSSANASASASTFTATATPTAALASATVTANGTTPQASISITTADLASSVIWAFWKYPLGIVLPTDASATAWVLLGLWEKCEAAIKERYSAGAFVKEFCEV